MLWHGLQQKKFAECLRTNKIHSLKKIIISLLDFTTMPYIRKTKDTYILMANYGQGWDEETEEETFREIKQRLKEYRENAGQYSYTYKKKREKIILTPPFGEVFLYSYTHFRLITQ
jgi:hypothetical protein